jgi:diguanylate cyclase (GGDEF)-like protein
MTNKPSEVNVLLVEDDHDDALIIGRHLRKMTRFSANLTTESDLDQALALCATRRFDAIFLDYYWGSFKADDYLRRHADAVRALPIIIITSTNDFTVNEAVIQAGAWDFVCKSDLGPTLLERTILHAMQRSRHEQELHQLIRHDSLTGLGNRMMFEEQLKRAVSRADRHNSRCAVMALDLDDFKQINDSLGHDVGDMLLRLVADRLNRGLREEDILARLGGDEFAILIEDVDSPEQLQIIASKLLAALRVPTPIRGISGRITGSFGITLYPDHGKSPLEMMRYADIALYAAKDGGRDRISVFDDELEEALLSGLELEQDLRQALEREEFVPYFQPRFFTDTQTLAGVEVLMRWQHPERGLLLPQQFIPTAERANLMLDMDRALVRTTLELLSLNQALPTPDNPYRLAFNITSAQLLDTNFARDMVELAAHCQVPPEVIEFEIVERMLVERRAQQTLRDLREAGFGLCIDDFGTGFSSFSYLKDLPVTCLKIDRSFIRELPGSEASHGICEAIVCVGKRLGLTVIGEGIETEEQMSVMQSLQVDSVQGFLMAHPMNFDQWSQCLARLGRQGVGHGE